MTTGWLGTKETFYLSPKRVSDISMKMLFSYIFQFTTDKSCQGFEVFGCLSFFEAGGFDYDPDRTLHESHLEEKDEKYFAMKGNSSFEAEKGIKCFDNMYLYVFLVYPMTVSKRRVIIHRLKGWERRILVVSKCNVILNTLTFTLLVTTDPPPLPPKKTM